METKTLFIIGLVLVVVAFGILIMKPGAEITGETFKIDEEIMDEVVRESGEEELLWYTWDHMPITYSFVEVPSENGVYKCVDMKKELIDNAFNSIEESTENIKFKEVEDIGDIEIYCLPHDISQVGDYYYTIADALPVIEDNKIISGELNFYTDSFPNLGTSNCYDTPMHEILHLFDFYDDENLEGIMSEVKQTKCLYKIDDWIVYKLDELYK